VGEKCDRAGEFVETVAELAMGGPMAWFAGCRADGRGAAWKVGEAWRKYPKVSSVLAPMIGKIGWINLRQANAWSAARMRIRRGRMRRSSEAGGAWR